MTTYAAHRESLGRFAQRRTGRPRRSAERPSTGIYGPVRLRAAASIPGHFAVCKAEFCGPYGNDQTSILRFIEDNWGLPRIGDQSFDAIANPILGHFDFTKAHTGVLLLNPSSGEVVTNTKSN